MYNEEVKKLESNVYGLKYIPSLGESNDKLDYIGVDRSITVHHSNGNGQFTERNYSKVLEEFKKIKNSANCIVEIGVARNFGNSSTELWLTHKNDDTHYFGIDIDMDNKMHHEQYKPNGHMIRRNSRDEKKEILDKMKEFGCEEIDVLFIDGDHSIDLVLNDWG